MSLKYTQFSFSWKAQTFVLIIPISLNETKQNLWVLLAMRKYLKKYENTEPDFNVKAWLDKNYLGSHIFEGYSTEQKHFHVPMWVLSMQQFAPAPSTTSSSSSLTSMQVTTSQAKDFVALRLQGKGQGRLYYRVGLKYAAAPSLAYSTPMDRGFAITRTYEPMDDPSEYVSSSYLSLCTAYIITK